MEQIYDECHELRPLSGRSYAFVLITYPRDGLPLTCTFRGTWDSGWDHPAEYEFIEDK